MYIPLFLSHPHASSRLSSCRHWAGSKSSAERSETELRNHFASRLWLLCCPALKRFTGFATQISVRLLLMKCFFVQFLCTFQVLRFSLFSSSEMYNSEYNTLGGKLSGKFFKIPLKRIKLGLHEFTCSIVDPISSKPHLNTIPKYFLFEGFLLYLCYLSDIQQLQ